MYFVGEKGVTKKQKGGSLHFFFFGKGKRKKRIVSTNTKPETDS